MLWPLRRHKLRSLASPFRESSTTPLCLLSPQSPLRWAFVGAPFTYNTVQRGGVLQRKEIFGLAFPARL